MHRGLSPSLWFGAMEKGNKKTVYQIADPFLHFWYAFALPNYSDPYYLSTKEERQAIQAPFNVHLGAAWERMVREELRHRPLPDVPGRWRKVARWWGTGLDRQPMEVDVVAESIDGKTLLVGEAKLTQTKPEIKRTQESLIRKAKNLPFAKDYQRVITRLFIAKGGDRDCVSLD